MATINLKLNNQQDADQLRQALQQYRDQKGEVDLQIHEGEYDAFMGDDAADNHVRIEAPSQEVIEQALRLHFEQRGEDWRKYQV